MQHEKTYQSIVLNKEYYLPRKMLVPAMINFFTINVSDM